MKNRQEKNYLNLYRKKNRDLQIKESEVKPAANLLAYPGLLKKAFNPKFIKKIKVVFTPADFMY